MFDPEAPFDKYLLDTKSFLKKESFFPKINPEKKEEILEDISPFEFKISPDCGKDKIKRGILLIHGFLDTPFAMKDLGEYFRSKCFLVRSILLPGHGTKPEDLLNVKLEEWLAIVEYGINSLKKDVDEVYVLGLSAGGALAFHYGLNPGDLKLNGIAAISPSIAISPLAVFAKVVGLFKKWKRIEKDQDYVKYESYPMNGVHQIFRLTEKLRESKNKITIPVMMVLSEDDTTVLSSASNDFFSNQLEGKKKLVIYKNKPAKNSHAFIEEKNSSYPELNILNFSHIALHISPENKHYGLNGDYKSCLHYSGDAKKNEECKSTNNKQIKYGETNVVDKKLISENELFRRLTFNPDFENMCEEIYSFLTGTD